MIVAGVCKASIVTVLDTFIHVPDSLRHSLAFFRDFPAFFRGVDFDCNHVPSLPVVVVGVPGHRLVLHVGTSRLGYDGAAGVLASVACVAPASDDVGTTIGVGDNRITEGAGVRPRPASTTDTRAIDNPDRPSQLVIEFCVTHIVCTVPFCSGLPYKRYFTAWEGGSRV